MAKVSNLGKSSHTRITKIIEITYCDQSQIKGKTQKEIKKLNKDWL